MDKYTFTDRVPICTGSKDEHHLLSSLKVVKVRSLVTLASVALALAGGKDEPLDDKKYLVERVIQLSADLPINNRLSHTLTNTILSGLWNELNHPPISYLGYEFAFRKPDGSNNNVLWPHIGKAGQPYARSVRPQRMQPPRPDPGIVFDSVLCRKEFRAHPNKVSSILFYLASIIVHDCFQTSHKDYTTSETSSYLDLSPLYGSNLKDQLSVRTMKNGKLKADCFADERILGFPPGVGTMLIMFNRFHNYVVEYLAKIDENGRFSSILKPEKRRNNCQAPLVTDVEESKSPEQRYDEALFQTARLVTCGLYINIILQDYVRVILGLNSTDSLWNLDPRADHAKAISKHDIPEAQGNQVSAEFSLIYRWHSCISQRDEQWIQRLIKKIAKLDPTNQNALFEWTLRLKDTDPQMREFDCLERGSDGRFSDDKLSQIWMDSVDDVAGSFGAAHVPESLKCIEILSMMQARRWNLASLNEFRQYFKLQPHKTFESINPDPKIARALEKLYGHPDNVEIYPGVVVEDAKKSMTPGNGLCASWTTSRAILADAVSLVRSDRFYTVDYTPNNLTNWGFQQAGYDLNINHGCVFYKLVLIAFPNHFQKNSIYAHYPFVNPDGNKAILMRLNRYSFYDFRHLSGPIDRHQKLKLPPKVAAVAATTVIETSNFASLSHLRSSMLSTPRIANLKANLRMTFAQAVLANEEWMGIAARYYCKTLEILWKEKQYELGGYQQIDVVADVLNPAHASFLASVLGVEEPERGLFSILEPLFGHSYSPYPRSKTPINPLLSIIDFLRCNILSLFGDVSEPSLDISKAIFTKMAQVNGGHIQSVVPGEILPTAALLLTILSRFSAAAIEEAIPMNDLHWTAYAFAFMMAPTNPLETARRRRRTITMSNAPIATDEELKILGPEIELASKIVDIANAALKPILEGIRGIERVPGPQGKIKKISSDVEGDVKYLNKTESEFLVYPVSLQLRWKKQD